jgi:tetratricopeptide (TPR) repeat protein
MAINDYNKLLDIDPGSVNGLVNRGIVYFQMDNKEKACNDWEKAMEKGSEYAKKYFKKNCK